MLIARSETNEAGERYQKNEEGNKLFNFEKYVSFFKSVKSESKKNKLTMDCISPNSLATERFNERLRSTQ